MKVVASKINKFLMFKLPSAYFCGVRVVVIDQKKCVVAVKHSWINKNPFNSIYFAVQAMAAELSTGALVMNYVQNSDKKIAMLVVKNKASFNKKATGRITFECTEGHIVADAVERAITTGEGQTFWMKSIATNEEGIQVSEMDFEWSIKVK